MARYRSAYVDDPSLEDDVYQSPRRGSALPWVLLLLVLAAAGAGGYLGMGMYQVAVDQRAAALKASAEAGSKVQGLEAARSELEEKVKALEAEKTSLSATVQAKDEELAKLKATYDSLNDQMKAEIEKGEIRLSQMGQRIQVDMVDKILFDSGQAEVSEHGAEVLAKIGSILAKVDDRQIQVSGHTDDSPITDRELQAKFPSNWELSAARAVNVVRFLSEKAKVPGKRLVATGYGQFHPVATNANHEGRARNRRIEILLAPEVESRPAEVAQADHPPPAKSSSRRGKTGLLPKKKTRR